MVEPPLKVARRYSVGRLLSAATELKSTVCVPNDVGKPVSEVNGV